MVSKMGNYSCKYSILMAVKNGGSQLIKTLKSLDLILDQRFELVIVDDGSTDGTKSVLETQTNKIYALKVIFLERNRKRFLGKVRQIAFENSSGEYVLNFIDHDDLRCSLMLDTLALYHSLEGRFGYGFYFCSDLQVCSSQLLEEAGGFQDIFFEDYDLHCRMMLIKRFVYCNLPTMRHRQGYSLPKKIYRFFWRKNILPTASALALGFTIAEMLAWSRQTKSFLAFSYITLAVPVICAIAGTRSNIRQIPRDYRNFQFYCQKVQDNTITIDLEDVKSNIKKC